MVIPISYDADRYDADRYAAERYDVDRYLRDADPAAIYYVQDDSCY